MVPPSPPGQVMSAVPSPLLTTVHAVTAPASPTGNSVSLPSAHVIFFTPPKEVTVQAVAPPSRGVPPRMVEVPSGQTSTFAPAAFCWICLLYTYDDADE